MQEYLHQTSGYLPVTMAAYEATKASGFYDENPGREQPIIQMMGKAPTENSRGVRLVNLPQVRDIQNEEFENLLAGKQTAQQALDNAVTRANKSIAPGARQLTPAARAPSEHAAGAGRGRPAGERPDARADRERRLHRRAGRFPSGQA